ncbi:MAG: enoyl-CoA hydratase [Halioglobus sp.]|jgi:enoyl-CoA hydratase
MTNEDVSEDKVLLEIRGNIGIVTLNRPKQRNAQDLDLLQQLDRVWMQAANDERVKVIVLNAKGPHFSAGHDITDKAMDQVTCIDWDNESVADLYNYEKVHFLEYCTRWRNISKPTIAAVQGACIAAGLMLIWPCDIIIAAENARFSDPVVTMGIGGVEYHAHTWELGARKAKEILFTSSFIDASTAEQLGMVNKVVALEDLDAEVMAMAEIIAGKPAFGLAMAKRAVNRTQDIQGYQSSLEAAFDMHQLGHANCIAATGKPIFAYLDDMKKVTKDGGKS